MPCPNSSLSGSCFWPTVIPSATVADSRDSSAASAATATAGASSEPNSEALRKARDGAGSPEGRSPIGAASSRRKTCAITVAAMTATIEKGTVGFHLAPASITAATPTERPIAVQFGKATNSTSARHATSRTFSPSGFSTPSALGICWRPITHAIPRVKPSTTGAGTYRMYCPARSRARPIRSTPAITPTVRTPPGPYWAMIGTRTTVIAPVGPDTWRFDPPNRAASAPATTAVASPASAPRPEETPNPSARGRATIATVSPASRSRRGLRAMTTQSARAGRTQRTRPSTAVRAVFTLTRPGPRTRAVPPAARSAPSGPRSGSAAPPASTERRPRRPVRRRR